ncbi:MAG: hypothetical protein ACYDAR_17625 [Thermomicrobiales bacterium]
MNIIDESGHYLTIAEAAAALGISFAEMIQRVRTGQYPAFIGEIPSEPPIVIPRDALGIAADDPVLAMLPPPPIRRDLSAIPLHAVPLHSIVNPLGPLMGTRRQRRHWVRRLVGHGILGLVRALVVFALFCFLLVTLLSFVTEPWSWFIGGQFTPYGHWHGVGTLTTDRGATFALSLDFRREGCPRLSCGNIRGQADLCTVTGETFHYSVGGDSHVWLKTNGSNPVFYLALSPAPDRSQRGDFALGGHWTGGTLQISDHLNSFGRVFNADGTHFTGNTLRHPQVALSGGLTRGSDTDFQRACQQLTAR